jgi:putative copper export protein
VYGLYLTSVAIHILAAATWIGGMAFLVLVVVPCLRRGDRARGAALLRETGVRFRAVGWVCFGLLVVTGTFNLSFRGVHLADFANAEWRASSFGRPLTVKLGAFVLVVLVSAVHDFVIGPRAVAALERGTGIAETERLRKAASWLGRLNALLALVLVAAAVGIVRGWP